MRQAVENYEIASQLRPRGEDRDRLLIDWGLALGCTGNWNEALDKFYQAAQRRDDAHIQTQIAMAFANLKQYDNALDALARAENLDQNFEPTYMYRGQIYEVLGNREAAAKEYRRALELNPDDQAARDALERVTH